MLPNLIMRRFYRDNIFIRLTVKLYELGRCKCYLFLNRVVWWIGFTARVNVEVY